MFFCVNNEFSNLNSVVLGIGSDFGGVPEIKDVYDPHSRENVIQGTFPNESEVVQELNQFNLILKKYGIKTYRPKNIRGLNQVFTRDIGFVIDDFFFISNVINERKKEFSAIEYILSSYNSEKIISLESHVNIEGGDVIVYGDKIFIGFSDDDDFNKYKVARTNINGVNFLDNFFLKKKIIPIQLNKSDFSIKDNCLHLDCCFQPLGLGHVVVCYDAFKNKNDVSMIESIFNENIIEISGEEMQNLNSNFFSISNEIVVSDYRFERLNQILIQKGYRLEKINYQKIAKMGGLLRCSTLPLNREL